MKMPDCKDLLTVERIAEEYRMGKSTVWWHLRRLGIARYRTPATGKKTLVLRQDWEKAISTLELVNQSPASTTRDSSN